MSRGPVNCTASFAYHPDQKYTSYKNHPTKQMCDYCRDGENVKQSKH